MDIDERIIRCIDNTGIDALFKTDGEDTVFPLSQFIRIGYKNIVYKLTQYAQSQGITKRVLLLNSDEYNELYDAIKALPLEEEECVPITDLGGVRDFLSSYYTNDNLSKLLGEEV